MGNSCEAVNKSRRVIARVGGMDKQTIPGVN